MTVKWFDAKIEKKVDKAKDAYIHGVGNILVNQMSDFAHIRSGLLKNSMIYIYENHQEPFGTFRGKEEGRNEPTPDEAISKPPQGVLRAGSGLVYAGPMEKHHGWFSKTIDTIKADGSLEKLGKAIFRKFFK